MPVLPMSSPADGLPLLAALLCLGSSLASVDALANGQTTHLWITEEALRILPEGDVRTMLARPDLRDPLLNGTMFPDGGYANGNDYGELAHWEPFQQAYLGWIRDTYPPPWNEGEAAEHLAFFLGMASHGMADEVFDSLFMERSRCYDPGWDSEDAALDTASDVLFAAAVGGVVAPSSWLPASVLVEIFEAALDYTVTEATVEEGHSRLFTALAYTEWARSDDERLATFGAGYPWSEEHLLDNEMPGSPPREAEVVAAYWQDLWNRLNDSDSWKTPILEFVPGDGALGHPRSADRVEARLHLSFSRGVDQASLDQVKVLDEAGAEVAVSVHHHYGNHSHAVHIEPEGDWEKDSSYQVVVTGPLLNYDGAVSSGNWTAGFSTRSPAEDDEEQGGGSNGCTCSASGGTGPRLAGLFWFGVGVAALGASRRPQTWSC